METNGIVAQSEFDVVNEIIAEENERKNILPDFKGWTQEQLIEVIDELNEDLARSRAVRDQQQKAIDNQLRISQELRVELAQWRYAARRLFFASVRVQTWVKTVRTNFDHIEGFTHHMKDVVQKLNGNILESVESELEQPVEKLRELAKDDPLFGDIPF